MKHGLSILITVCALLGLSSCTDSKVVEKKIWVRGNCDMCQERIETNVKLINGVKAAHWDVNTKLLSVKYDSTLANELAVETICANVGHATKAHIGNPKAIQELPECCQPE